MVIITSLLNLWIFLAFYRPKWEFNSLPYFSPTLFVENNYEFSMNIVCQF